MDKLGIPSVTYLLYLAVSFGLVAVCYFLFAKRSRKTKLIFLYVVAGLNVVQHLFKSVVWPHLHGTGFKLSNTFYNVCATIILLTPFFLHKESGVLREAVALVGSVGTILALVVPFWYIDKSILQWDFARFWTCHELLLLTSLLPILWRMVRFRFADFWKIGLCFIGVLCIILLNDVICISCGLYGNGTANLSAALSQLNPFCIMHPMAQFAWMERFVRLLTPSFFMGANGVGYTPILWYAIPLYLAITLVALPIMWLLDRYSNKVQN